MLWPAEGTPASGVTGALTSEERHWTKVKDHQHLEEVELSQWRNSSRTEVTTALLVVTYLKLQIFKPFPGTAVMVKELIKVEDRQKGILQLTEEQGSSVDTVKRKRGSNSVQAVTKRAL